MTIAAPADKPRIPRAVALAAAEELIALIRPVCARIEVAGSLRRAKESVADIEVVAMPLPLVRDDLFGGEISGPYEFGPAFTERLRCLRSSGVLAADPANAKDGSLYKRFLLAGLGGYPCDLFLATPDNWGNQMAIRTGSAAFSKFLMSHAWRHARRRQQGGYLWQCQEGDEYEAPVPAGRPRIACPEERDYFNAVGVPFLDPWYRDEATAERLRREASYDRR